MRREVAEPVGLGLAKRALRLDEVATQEADLVPEAGGGEIAVERAVERLVLRQRDPRPVGLVLDGDPAHVREPSLLDEVDEDARELRHRARGVALAAAGPGDVHDGAGALRELHRADERLHQVGVGEGVSVEEDADELRLERDDLRLHVGQVLVGHAHLAADRGVDILVELRAVAREARDEHLGRLEREVASLDDEVRLVVRRGPLPIGRVGDAQGDRALAGGRDGHVHADANAASSGDSDGRRADRSRAQEGHDARGRPEVAARLGDGHVDRRGSRDRDAGGSRRPEGEVGPETDERAGGERAPSHEDGEPEPLVPREALERHRRAAARRADRTEDAQVAKPAGA